ncbi:hypothetical protein [Stenotrophomonas sp. NY11291]|uniref:hypothetical protein n=1 Tax=Stenotrophomonas sp. NY11291 TaxID=2939415 RepID=UPI00200D4F57|nr:hypothetical protein [Stenotrophomonas sp. NY11291]UQA24431.1 hypothetical protein M1L61_09755 [Stenotrophomonas sp. NY11291]
MKNTLKRLLSARRVSNWGGFWILRHSHDGRLIDVMGGSRQVSWRGPERALVVEELAEKLSMCCPELHPEEKNIELAEMAAKSQHQGPESCLFREMRDLVVDGANPEFMTEQGSYFQLLMRYYSIARSLEHEYDADVVGDLLLCLSKIDNLDVSSGNADLVAALLNCESLAGSPLITADDVRSLAASNDRAALERSTLHVLAQPQASRRL